MGSVKKIYKMIHAEHEKNILAPRKTIAPAVQVEWSVPKNETKNSPS